MSLIDDALTANATLAADYDSSNAGPPKPRIAVVTRADPRLTGILGLLGLADAAAPRPRPARPWAMSQLALSASRGAPIRTPPPSLRLSTRQPDPKHRNWRPSFERRGRG